ncbi:ribonuclease catalytic domain-containing protein [Sulfuritalea hydrogenivorans]|jgi:exoribonuclease-2|uniref:Ribonuclease II n=1 Tax=Sulfuritalea hydrogenivorans sk43H TaxID=1223802 RepID=W0SK20_9PROT|nr:RNB domain-containing ribonuclease [Sulfuritalea hydrogenivorans]BAO31181.1 ribonuclease II [Sulfuritalea hydrogenivorans sk43H]
MNVLFEEDGAFRAGTVLADNVASLQIELASGKRSKVKAANVLLRFSAPAPGELLERAEADAEGIDVDFLWEVCGEAEFGFEELAAEYHGSKPDPVQAAAVLLRLHSAPIHFHRKGRGRFRKAPPEILEAALAGLERKRQQAAAIERMVEELKRGQLPAEFTPLLTQLIYKPDRNRPETKALEAACNETGKSAARLLFECGALPSTHDYHLGRFLFEFFPESKGGTGFPQFAAPREPADLPLAKVAAFSVDDAHTTEIDDAFSVTANPDGGWHIGIHIAAPGLGFGPDSDLGRIARERLSTVYMPGRKITMLPEDIVEHFTLAAGHTVAAISLYLDVAADYRLLGHETRMEQVPIVANLRHHDIEPVFNETTLAAGLTEFPYRDELKLLWEFAQVLEAGRGKPSDNSTRKDYNFIVDWAAESGIAAEPGKGFVSIDDRARGSPLDTLVAELMIMANATWGAMLRDAGIPALYRVQTAGKVRMSTVAAAHEGLGVECYAWSSSPLRRYCDLLNQWQLIALLREEAPPFPPKSADLLAAMRDFELTYAAYAEFQRGMERYWCLRWLLQQGMQVALAQVLRESLVRLDAIPLVARAPSVPELPRGARVQLAVEGIDLLEAELRLRYLELAPELAPNTGSDAALADDEGEEVAE